MLEAIIHEKSGLREMLFGDLGGGDAVVTDDQVDGGQEIAEHGGFVAPDGGVEGAIRGKCCALIFW